MYSQIWAYLYAELSELVQHILIYVVHLFGVHSLRTRIKALEVPQKKPQSVSQLEREAQWREKESQQNMYL